MIEQVEYLRPKVNPLRFSNWERPRNCDIGVPRTGTTQRIAALVAVHAAIRSCRSRCARWTVQRRERLHVEPLLNRWVFQLRGTNDVRKIAATGARIIRSLQHCERTSGRRRENRRFLPVPQDFLQYMVGESGRPRNDRRIECMRSIGITAAVIRVAVVIDASSTSAVERS